MTVDDVQQHYGYDWRQFVKRAGMGRRTWFRWQADGYIPMHSQITLQYKTRGKLKADPKHDGRMVRESRMYGGGK